jgi:ribosomal protein S18 acetylase RimI-like enzyme
MTSPWNEPLDRPLLDMLLAGRTPPLRLAVPADAVAMAALWEEQARVQGAPPPVDGANALRRWLQDPGMSLALVVERNGVVAGMVVLVLMPWPPTAGLQANVDELIVAKAHRGHGLGRALLTAVDVLCVHLGVSFLQLQVRPELHAAVGLYRSSGWEADGRQTWVREPGRR